MQNYYQRPPFRQPYPNIRSANSPSSNCREKNKAGQTVAMAYVPWQLFSEPCPASKGLQRGTLFEELDKPFLGRGGCRS